MPPRSRQTRHQEATSRSRQGHIIDLDPTDGLPVQRWGLMKVTINQGNTTDPSTTNPKSTSSAEWAAQFNTEQHPWSENPFPSYINQLQPWNQELLRAKRAGNTNSTLSIYDRKTHSWISGAEQERKAAAAKLNSLNTTDSAEKPRNGNDAESPKSADDSGAEDSSNEYNKSADEDEFDGDEAAPFKPSSTKRRKVTSRHNNLDNIRSFDVTKWVPLPPQSVDRSQDRTGLASRRPGMPPLYNNPEYTMKIFGKYHSSSFLAGASGYDVGEGGGLSNASGVLTAGSTNDTGVATPRKNVPPRRKKKKLGGPGRKKANPNPISADTNNQSSAAATDAAGQGTGSNAMDNIKNENGQNTNASGNTTRNPGYDGANDDATAHDDDNENDNENESGSEAEGSEEGEIDESGGGVGVGSVLANADAAENPATVAITTASNPVDVTTEITVADTKPTESKPIDEAKDVASPAPVTDTTMSTDTITTTEPDVAAAPPTDIDTEIDAAPAAAPTTKEPQQSPPLPNPTVTITDTDIDPDTTMPDADTKDPEETVIIEENAQAITGTGAADTDTNTDTATATATKKSEETTNTEAATEEIDFLGGLDAAIDRDMNE